MLHVMPRASRIGLIVLARVGAALVRVVQQPGSGQRRFSARSSALIARCRSLTGADRPADDEPRVQIEDRGEVQLAALADHELGGVADPAPVRRGPP